MRGVPEFKMPEEVRTRRLPVSGHQILGPDPDYLPPGAYESHEINGAEQIKEIFRGMTYGEVKDMERELGEIAKQHTGIGYADLLLLWTRQNA